MRCSLVPGPYACRASIRASSSGSSGSTSRTAGRHGIPAGRCSTSQSRTARVARTSSSLYRAIRCRRGRVTVAHPVLVLDDRPGAAVDVMAALVAGELLDVLQPVGLHADLQGAGDDRVEVDEQPAGDEGFDLLLDDAMRFGQALQRASFRVVVVVHVHAWERLEPSAQVVHQPDDRCGLLGAVVRPERPIDPLPGVAFDQAEQEEQADVGLPERVAFVVQEHVPLIRRRERSEPPQDRLPAWEDLLAGGGVVQPVRGEDLERRRIGGSQASLLLQGRLTLQQVLAQRVEPCHRVVQVRQAGQRVHPVGFQELSIRQPRSRDEHQGVRSTPLRLADRLELTEPAVATGRRPGRVVRRVLDESRQR